jgi:hypothetical protein
MILSELWRKTSVVVPDCPHHVVQRGVHRMVRIYGARRAAGRRVRKGNEALGGEGARLALQHGADYAGLRYSCWREPSTERAGTRNIGYGIGMD